MSLPDETRTLNIDDLMFKVELYKDEMRFVAIGPLPGRMPLHSEAVPTYGDGQISWGMIDQIIARRVDQMIRANPERWNKWYGPDGKYTKDGQNA